MTANDLLATVTASRVKRFRIIALVSLLYALMAFGHAAPPFVDPGQALEQAFGRLEPADIEHLVVVGRDSGFDLREDLERLSQMDENALARFFRFSTEFKFLDKSAKTYGHILYNTFLHLSDMKGVDAYARVLNSQRTEVRQRIRDFLYYPNRFVPAEERAKIELETRQAYPILFPTEFQFGQNDPIFARESW